MTLRMKTVLGVALIEAVLLVILLSSVFRYMHQSNEDGLQEYTTTLANLFATATKDAVISYDLAAIESYVSEIMKNKGVLYTRVFDGNQQLLASENKSSYRDSEFKEDFSLADVDDKVFDTRATIEEGGGLYGVVQIGVSTDRINEALSSVKQLGIGLAVFEMLLVALFSSMLGIYLTRQLSYLRGAARKVAVGDLNHQLIVKGKDEVADLGHSFNLMLDSLNETEIARQKYQNDLEELNKNLEARVERRTEQLSNKNNELERAYEDLKTAQAALLQSEKMASLGQMAAGVAHEINNPMAFIKSNLGSLGEYLTIYTKLMDLYDQAVNFDSNSFSQHQQKILIDITKIKAKEDFDFISEDAQGIIEDSIDGAERISDIVQGLKSFSRIDQAEIQCVNLNDCLDDTLKIIKNQIKHKCQIRRDFSELPDLCCNPGKLNQVFMNLIINASQAITDNGRITIKTAVDKNKIRVSIRDTGSGIAKENIDKLFDPFFTTKPVGEGTGLGLAISHGIVEEHKGSIEVTSEVGLGTEFIVVLPIVEDQK